jgi:hypothetical protein
VGSCARGNAAVGCTQIPTRTPLREAAQEQYVRELTLEIRFDPGRDLDCDVGRDPARDEDSFLGEALLYANQEGEKETAARSDMIEMLCQPFMAQARFN